MLVIDKYGKFIKNEYSFYFVQLRQLLLSESITENSNEKSIKLDCKFYFTVNSYLKNLDI